jgi:two-component system NtrC family sensor kinase
MNSFFDLSFRYKIPVWGSLLIVSTVVAVSGALMVRSYDDLKQDMLTSSTDLGQTLAITLYPSLLQDDVWRVFEIINAPIKGATANNVLEPETIVVLDDALDVVVSSDPRAIPMLAKLGEINAEFAALAKRITPRRGDKTQIIDLPNSQHLFVTTPIVDEGNRLGTLVNVHSKDVYLPRFFRVAEHGGLMGLLVLAVLLPINWYWGQRMTRPLVQIADRMDRLDQGTSGDLDPAMYAYHDELGRLFEAYRRMLSEQEKKEALERQMVQSERLAAVGRLAAGMAHEINNPLGGMLTAIDTLKSHGETDPRTAKTIALIERGLTQIRETVGALLVEARMKSRDLEPQDIEDVRSLVTPQAHKKGLRLDWDHTLAGPVRLQASLVRQILINLLLNAIQAAEQSGMVTCLVEAKADALCITVENDGKLLTTNQMAHLFEPFSPLSENGHGLGLWVTYQIVQQLAGQITVAHHNDHMRFSVSLPLGEKT